MSADDQEERERSPMRFVPERKEPGGFAKYIPQEKVVWLLLGALVGTILSFGKEGLWRLVDGGVTQGYALSEVKQEMRGIKESLAEIKLTMRSNETEAFTDTDAAALKALLDLQIATLKDEIAQHGRRLDALELIQRSTPVRPVR